MLINFWEIRSLSGLQKIRSPCCQLTQHEQKPLSEKVGSFPQVSVCVCPGPVRSKLWGSGARSKGGCEGHKLRIQISVLSEGERTWRRQLGKNILDGSSEGSSVPQGWWGAKSCYPRSPASPRNRPAFESSLTHWGVWPHGSGATQAMDVRMGGWTLWVLCSSQSSPDCALSRPPQPTLALLHRCKKIFCVIPPGPLFLSEILNNINHLNFD